MSGEVERPDPTPAQAFRSGGRLLAMRAVTYGFLFLAGLVVTRALGPSDRGHFALAVSLAMVVSFTLMLSLDASIGRLLARRDASVTELTRLVSAATLVLGAGAATVTLAIGLPARDQLLGGANVASVALAAALVPMIMGTQLAAGLLLRLGALRSYGRATMAGAALQLAVLVALEVRPGLSPELALTASLAGASLTTAGLAVALARRAGARALIPS